MTLREKKTALRDEGRHRRSGVSAAAARDAAIGLRDNVLSAIPTAAGSIVSGYWPIGDEIDVRPLLILFHDQGQQVALPDVVEPGGALTFRAWKPGSPLEKSVFGTSVPPPSSPQLVPDTLLVPALAVDIAGYRVGYGGGYYDRTLAALRRAASATAIGVCFECQFVEDVPHDGSDERMDWIVTERDARQIL